MRKGFTLAEVLITLGIIGVVAALTMPSLMVSYKKKVTVNKLKRNVHTFGNGYTLSEAHNGFADTWSFDVISDDAFYDFLEIYIFPYIKMLSTCRVSELDKCQFELNKRNYLNGDLLTGVSGYKAAAVLYDGTSVLFDTLPGYNYIIVFADLNGNTGPNIVGKDIFRLPNLFYNTERGFSFGGQQTHELSRDDLLSPLHSYACNKSSSGEFCSMLIVQDGWEIKDDYPW